MGSAKLSKFVRLLHHFVWAIFLVGIAGCATHSYDSKEQFAKHDITFTQERIGLNLGIEVRDTLPREIHEATKDDISDGTAEWLASELSDKFAATTDLNAHPERRRQVDVVLEVDIRNIIIDSPGVSGVSMGLAVFYGVAPVFEHYAVDKTVLAYGELEFRLLSPSSGSAFWEYRLKDKAKDEVQLASRNQLVFAVIANAVEHFIYSTEFLAKAKSIEQHGVPSAATPDPPQQKAKFTPSSQGSGWLLNPYYVVTNYHVVEDAKILAVRTRGGVPIKARVLVSDKVNDLALLELSEAVGPGLGVQLALRSLQAGDRVFAFGYPLSGLMGDNVKITEGIVNSTTGIDNDPRMYQISAGIQKGNSGGPVVNEYGEVIGVATGKLNTLYTLKVTGDIPQNVNYAVKSQYVQALIESAGVDVGGGSGSQRESMSARQVAEMVSKSVVRVESFEW